MCADEGSGRIPSASRCPQKQVPLKQLQPAPVQVMVEEQLRFWHCTLHVAPSSQVTVGRESLLVAVILHVDPASHRTVIPAQTAEFSQLTSQVSPALHTIVPFVEHVPPFSQRKLQLEPSSHVMSVQSTLLLKQR